MKAGMLEHVNFTVRDPQATARVLEKVFGWRVRWEGGAAYGGYTVHVGTDEQYVGLYSQRTNTTPAPDSYTHIGAMNHLAVVVEDLDAVERRVKAAGFETHDHADYEPGRRFYFHDGDDVEYEVVSYA